MLNHQLRREGLSSQRLPHLQQKTSCPSLVVQTRSNERQGVNAWPLQVTGHQLHHCWGSSFFESDRSTMMQRKHLKETRRARRKMILEIGHHMLHSLSTCSSWRLRWQRCSKRMAVPKKSSRRHRRHGANTVLPRAMSRMLVQQMLHLQQQELMTWRLKLHLSQWMLKLVQQMLRPQLVKRMATDLGVFSGSNGIMGCISSLHFTQMKLCAWRQWGFWLGFMTWKTSQDERSEKNSADWASAWTVMKFTVWEHWMLQKHLHTACCKASSHHMLQSMSCQGKSIMDDAGRWLMAQVQLLNTHPWRIRMEHLNTSFPLFELSF